MFDRYAYVQMKSGNLWAPMTRWDSIGEAIGEAICCLNVENEQHYRVTHHGNVVYEIWIENEELIQRAYGTEFETRLEDGNWSLSLRELRTRSHPWISGLLSSGEQNSKLSWQECGF